LPTRRFEGRNLEDALARACTEVGSEARVVAAERVRSGGIGGFFARERVEIEVELEDAAVAPQPDAPASLLDIADRISSEEQEANTAPRAERGRANAKRRMTVRPDAVTTGPPSPSGPAPSAAGPVPAPPQVIELGPPAPAAAPQVPHLSTETSTFAEILERITAETTGHEAPDRAAPDHAAALDGADGHDVPGATEQPLPPVPVPASATPAARHAAPVAPSPVAPAPDAPAAVDAAPVAPRPAVQLVVRAAPPAPLAFPRPRDDGGPLARLGLPPELEPAGPDLRDALVAQLAALPQPAPLPSSRGTVIAVVGPPGLAYQTARTIRSRVGTDAPIATFSPRGPAEHDAALDEVSDQRRGWRRRPAPTVAVVDAPVGRPTEWAADALCALEPTAVWGIVEASRKVEDIEAWSSGLGGVDALCLTGIDDTVSPAAALRTGLPVALLEGQPATAERWADVLLARLASEKELACSDS